MTRFKILVLMCDASYNKGLFVDKFCNTSNIISTSVQSFLMLKAMMCIERIDAFFEYYIERFDGMDFHLRRNKATGEVDLMLSDNYAKVNGFDNLRQLFEHRLGYRIEDAFYNRIASALKWVRVGNDGLHPITEHEYSACGMVGDA